LAGLVRDLDRHAETPAQGAAHANCWPLDRFLPRMDEEEKS
jgi:hypothetical protein